MALFEKVRFRGPGKFPQKPEHPPVLADTPLVVNPQALAHPEEPVTELLYGGLVEHLGRCVYGGLVDNPKDPSPAELLEKRPGGRLGWRKDVKEVFAHDGDLQIPMMRWPGGNFVSNYHFLDAVGPLEQRKPIVELAWNTEDPNTFGTDEFIEYCRALDVIPYICLNMGSGTMEEALAWVEYCNGSGNTYYANLRRKNGHEEPYGVKYWGLGNEVWGPWQVGFSGPTEYAAKAKQWSHSLKLLDPSLKLVLCGNTGSTEWDREILSTCINYVDYISIHFYSQPRKDSEFPYEEQVFSPAAAERNIDVCQSLIDLANIENSVLGIPANNVKICFDEWNVYDMHKYPSHEGAEQPYDLECLVAFCAWLNLLVRKHQESPINCLAQFVNCLAPVMTTPNGLMKQSIYYPFRLFSRYMKNGHLINLDSHPDKYLGPTNPEWIQQLQLRPSYVDSCAIIVEEGSKHSIRLSILNRHPSADWKLNLNLLGFEVDKVEMHEMYHDNVSIYNTFEKPNELVPATTSYSAKEWAEKSTTVSIRKHSWCFFIIDGKKIQ